MGPYAQVPAARAGSLLLSPWAHVAQVAAALAAGMAVGRFVYTPILPLMHAQAGLSATAGADLATGAQLRFPRSVALLTAGYSVGQILGPLAVAPLLHHGHRPAPLLAAVVVMAAAAAAAVLRIGFPRRAVAVRPSVPAPEVRTVRR